MAPFSRTLKKSLSTYICFALAAVATSSAMLAHHYRGRVKKAEAALSKEQGKSAAEKVAKVSPQEHTYLKALGAQFGYDPKENEPFRDAVSVAARLNAQLNFSTAAEYNAARTPWLPPPPKTLKQRIIAGAKQTPFSLGEGKIELPELPVFFQYSIVNPTDTSIPMPILHTGIRWDIAEKIVETAGLPAIADEVDRAIAIWRFVAEHRYHAMPVTEGPEEHDLVKYLACYGYGFCDDTAQAVAGIAKLCGMEARIVGLEGHVVPEVYAAGRWMMLDADFAVYFHQADDPRAILSVEELAKDRAAFKNAVQLGKGGPYEDGYADPFLSTGDNKPVTIEARTEHRIECKLTPGERVVFSNYNWGEYFVGAFPQRVPRYFNGYFERPLTADAFTLPSGLEIRREGETFTIVNLGKRDKRADTIITCPFPVVGGSVSSPTSVKLEFEDNVVKRKFILKEGREVSFSSVVTAVSKQPTTSFSVMVVVPAGGMVKFEKPMRLFTHFQFAELPLLRLKKGTTDFRTFTPEPSTLDKLTGEIFWK